MNKTRNVVAIDLGAESGRVLLIRYDGYQLYLEEMHRFANRSVYIRGQRFWNILSLWDDILLGLHKARQHAGSIDSIGVDTWAVDYGLIDQQGLLAGIPYHYRDHRTDGIMEQVWERVPRELIYARTGIQFLPFNTLYQLYAQEQSRPGCLQSASRMLMIPDLLHCWLSGSLVSERTNATTTQIWDPLQSAWASDLLDPLGLPTHLLPPVVEPGTVLGDLLPELQRTLGSARVIAPATHDTGSAIVAIPVSAEQGWGYISSGTWSLVGVELPQPLLTAASLAANFTNEGGAFGTTRYLKNVMGLWLLQECQRQWAQNGHTMDYDTLLADVDSVPPLRALIDPDDPRFLAPDDMLVAINTYLVEHQQAQLQAPAAFARCIMESLVLRYCEVFRQVTELTGIILTRIHVLGGGSRNSRLNQWLADALAVPVIAGPVEATAQGNALMQLVGLGELATLADARSIAQHGPTQEFLPRTAHLSLWNEAAERFRALLS